MSANGTLHVKRVWRHVRQHGLADTCWRLLHRARLVSVCHSLKFWGYDLSRPLPEAAPREAVLRKQIVFREVDPSELKALRYAQGVGTALRLERPMSRGSRLFAALLSGRVVAVNLIRPGMAELHYINRPAAPLAEGTVYLHGAVTGSAYRRKGIASALRSFVLRTLKAEGYRCVLLATFLDNGAAESWNQSNGFDLMGRITWLRLGRRHDLWQTRLTPAGRDLPSILDMHR